MHQMQFHAVTEAKKSPIQNKILNVQSTWCTLLLHYHLLLSMLCSVQPQWKCILCNWYFIFRSETNLTSSVLLKVNFTINKKYLLINIDLIIILFDHVTEYLTGMMLVRNVSRDVFVVIIEMSSILFEFKFWFVDINGRLKLTTFTNSLPSYWNTWYLMK